MKYYIVEVRQLKKEGKSRFVEIAFSDDGKNFFRFNGEYSFHLGNDVIDFDQEVGKYHNAETVTTKLIVTSYDDVKGHILKQLKDRFWNYSDIMKLKEDFVEYNKGFTSVEVTKRSVDFERFDLSDGEKSQHWWAPSLDWEDGKIH